MENNTDFNKMISERLITLEAKTEALISITIEELSNNGIDSKEDLKRKILSEIDRVHPIVFERHAQKYTSSFLQGLNGENER